MANKNHITIVIDGNGNAAIASVGQVKESLDTIEKKSEGVTKRIRKHWVGMSAAVVGAYMSIQKAWNLAEQAAKYEQSRQAFKSMVQNMGMDAEKEFNKIKQASGGLIDNQNLIEAANRAMSLQIPIEKLGDLMKIARAKARDMGITTTQAFNDIATGIGRGSPLIIDNLGITLKLGSANEAYARSINKTVDQLNDYDKKQAILNAVLDSGSESLDRHNLALLTNYERMQKVRATVENMKLVLGALIIRIGVGLVGVFQLVGLTAVETGKMLLSPFALIEKGLNKLGISQATYMQDAFNKLDQWDDKLRTDMVDSFKAVVAKSEDLAGAGAKVNKTLDDQAVAAANTTKKIDSLNSSIQDLIDKSTMMPVELIKKQSDAWLEAGADRVKVDKWVSLKSKEYNEQGIEDYLAYMDKKRSADRDEVEERIANEQEAIEKIRELDIEQAEFRKQTYRESWEEIFNIANSVKGELGAGLGMMAGGIKGMADIEAGEDPYSQQIAQLEDYIDRKSELMYQAGMDETQIWDMVAQKEMQIEKLKQQQKLSMIQNGFGAMSGMMYAFYAASGKQSKVAFEAFKAFKIAETITNTYSAAMGAYNAMASIPFVGPALGIAAAAAAIATGAARVQQIAAMRPGGNQSVAGGGSTSAGGGYSYNRPTVPKFEPRETKSETPPTIIKNYHFYGTVLGDVDDAGRVLAPAIRKAEADEV